MIYLKRIRIQLINGRYDQKGKSINKGEIYNNDRNKAKVK